MGVVVPAVENFSRVGRVSGHWLLDEAVILELHVLVALEVVEESAARNVGLLDLERCVCLNPSFVGSVIGGLVLLSLIFKLLDLGLARRGENKKLQSTNLFLISINMLDLLAA